MLAHDLRIISQETTILTDQSKLPMVIFFDMFLVRIPRFEAHVATGVKTPVLVELRVELGVILFVLSASDAFLQVGLHMLFKPFALPAGKFLT